MKKIVSFVSLIFGIIALNWSTALAARDTFEKRQKIVIIFISLRAKKVSFQRNMPSFMFSSFILCIILV